MSQEPKKRGRKRTKNLYFGPDQEEAVVNFLTSESYYERNKIYNQFLKAPIEKMVESIIRRYKLYRKGYEYEDIHSDTLSFLMTKMHNFLGQLIKDEKKMKSDIPYEDAYKTVETMDEYVYEIDKESINMNSLIVEVIDGIKLEINNTKLSDNEIKIGNALVTILENWETIFEQSESGNKYNKNLILSYIREMCDLSTKDIRVGMRRFKKLYFFFKEDKINEA
jgi:hypothetical protein